MSGMDKAILARKLEALGWREATLEELTPEDRKLAEHLGYHWFMVPPEGLWAKRAPSFYVYEARDLQDLLGEAVPED